MVTYKERQALSSEDVSYSVVSGGMRAKEKQVGVANHF